jgi:hypothetical protein
MADILDAMMTPFKVVGNILEDVIVTSGGALSGVVGTAGSSITSGVVSATQAAGGIAGNLAGEVTGGLSSGISSIIQPLILPVTIGGVIVLIFWVMKN